LEPVRGESQLGQAVSRATARIHEIIDDAERISEGLRAEAEAEADRYLADRKREADRAGEELARRLNELGRVLRERARYVSEQVEGLAAALDRVVAEIRAGTGGESEDLTVGARDEPQPQQPLTGGRNAGDEVLLRAVQLAVSGSDREEIESALTREFGLDQPDAIVDKVLGHRSP